MYNSLGEKTWEAEYDMYGKVRKLAKGSLSDCPFRYQGQYEDVETGLYYNRFRYYASDEGVYLSQDPIRLFSGEPNFYSYVNDSNNWVDIFGLNPLALPAPSGTNPWGSGTINSILVPKGGMDVEMAMSPGQIRPGGWATTDNITDVDFVRNQLAVTPEFKPEVSHVQKFHIPEGTRVQIGSVGPQIHDGKLYKGGGNQVQILNYADRAKLKPIGKPRKISCG